MYVMGCSRGFTPGLERPLGLGKWGELVHAPAGAHAFLPLLYIERIILIYMSPIVD
jgi:hypothetical protein